MGTRLNQVPNSFTCISMETGRGEGKQLHSFLLQQAPPPCPLPSWLILYACLIFGVI